MLDANGNYTSLQDSGYTISDLEQFFDGLAGKYHIAVGSGDVGQLASKLQGQAIYMTAHGGDPRLAFAAYDQQYARRAGNTPGVPTSQAQLNAPVTAANIAVAPAPSYIPPPIVLTPTIISGPSVGPTGLSNLSPARSVVSGPASVSGVASSPGIDTQTLMLYGALAVGAYLVLRTL